MHQQRPATNTKNKVVNPTLVSVSYHKYRATDNENNATDKIHMQQPSFETVSCYHHYSPVYKQIVIDFSLLTSHN